VIQKIDLGFIDAQGVSLYLKRLDLLEEVVTGNKWFKLKYNIKQANDLRADTLITFGGAFSNHLFAFAKACSAYNKRGVAYVRGDGMDDNNPTLKFLKKAGVELHFLDRETYRKKSEIDFITKLKIKYPNCWIIPEGGSNILGYKGTKEILNFDHAGYSAICVSAGTGCTAAGIISKSTVPVEVYSALSGNFLKKEIAHYLDNNKAFDFIEEYNFGGFGRSKATLIDFINSFYEKTGVPLDPIYNGKLLYGIIKRIQDKVYAPNSKILAIHTGGLQGILGYNYRFPNRQIMIAESALSL
jgi:1-aminocyclopropane-1-carboxylate deaminase